jgi:hypothetical protein
VAVLFYSHCSIVLLSGCTWTCTCKKTNLEWSVFLPTVGIVESERFTEGACDCVNSASHLRAAVHARTIMKGQISRHAAIYGGLQRWSSPSPKQLLGAKCPDGHHTSWVAVAKGFPPEIQIVIMQQDRLFQSCNDPHRMFMETTEHYAPAHQLTALCQKQNGSHPAVHMTC